MAGVVVIPYQPRPLQKVLHAALDGHRFAVAVCHRRFGKTVLAVNQLQKKALICTKPRPRFAYIAPTYRQGKAIAWDYMKHFAGPIPGHSVNESEMRIDYPNGGQVRIYGADNPDSLRGLYFDGVVLDEYGLMDPTIWEEVVRATLTDREGWAFFIGTPNGKNQFYDIASLAQKTPSWFYASYKASQTAILPAGELASARTSMSEDDYQQEFECSFEASVKGAVYARELQAVREHGRVRPVPFDPSLPVDTDWDLGIGDSTAIWFSQSSPAGEVRLIDYYESSGVGLPHYKQMLDQRSNLLGYVYGDHWAPHDIEVRELGSGHSRREAARGIGLYFRVAKKLPLMDGINATRMLFPRCYFDAERCQAGLETLQHYKWDYNTRIKEFKDHLPVHDWASHGADAFRVLAIRHRTPSELAAKDVARRERMALRAAQEDPDGDPWNDAIDGTVPAVPMRHVTSRAGY